MEKEKGKLYFSLPGFWAKFNLNVDLLNLYAQHRELFCDDIVIDSFYDCFPCLWNGGRVLEGTVSEPNIRATAEPFERADISLRLTFTNALTTEEDVDDHEGNLVCRLLESERNGVNSAPGPLRDHIRKRYPKFYHINSTTMRAANVDKVNMLSKDMLTVPDYRINNDFDALAKLEHPENIELLVAEECIDSCPNRRHHYEDGFRLQRGLESEGFGCPYGCEGSKSSIYETAFTRKHHITPEAMRERYLPLGFNQFKISGRLDADFENIERYVIYLVKPEHRDLVRSKLLNGMAQRN